MLIINRNPIFLNKERDTRDLTTLANEHTCAISSALLNADAAAASVCAHLGLIFLKNDLCFAISYSKLLQNLPRASQAAPFF